MFNIKKPSGDHLAHRVELLGRVDNVQNPSKKKTILLITAVALLITVGVSIFLIQKNHKPSGSKPAGAGQDNQQYTNGNSDKLKQKLDQEIQQKGEKQRGEAKSE